MAEQEPVPAWLEGGWRRAGLALGGGMFVEHSNVLWLQAGAYFADLRIPYEPVEPGASNLDVAQAFSGKVRFDRPRVTWRHDLDTMPRPPGHEDSAVIEDHGAILVERGEGYVERWQRERASGPIAVVQRICPNSGSPRARVVVVAHLAVAVWLDPVPGGSALAHRRGAWSTVATVGKDPADGAGTALEAVEILVQCRGSLADWQRVP